LLWSFVKANKVDYVGGLAGQVSGLIHDLKPAGVVLEEIVSDTVDILTNKLPVDVTAG
jgi:hypothetical protein